MANVALKISALVACTSPTSNDVLVLVANAGSNTEKATIPAVVAAGGNGVFEPHGTIHTISIKTSDYEIANTDKGALVIANSSSNIVFTIPEQANSTFENNTRIDVLRYGTGELSITNATNVTLNSANSDSSIAEQYQTASLIRMANNEWLLMGALKT